MRRTEKNGRFAKRGWRWLLLIVACLGVFALRHNLAGLGVDILLKRTFKEHPGATFAYSQIAWNGKTIVIDELDIQTPEYRLAVQRLEIVLDTSFSRSLVSPHIWVFHPYLIFQSAPEGELLASHSQALIGSLALMRWARLDVLEGCCEWTPREDTDSENLYFQLTSGTQPETLGVLEVFAASEMVGNPLMHVELGVKNGINEQYTLAWESHNLATHHILPLVWTIGGQAIQGWERIEGEWDLKGYVAFNNQGEIAEVNTTSAVKNLELRNTQLGLHAAAHHLIVDLEQLTAEATLSKTPWYQRVEARALIEEGEIACTGPLSEHPWAVTHVQGHMVWCENEDPTFSLKGITIQQDGERELFVQGTGSLGNESSFWLQSFVTWGEEAKPYLESTISICSPEPASLVVEAQVNELQMNAAASLAALFGWKENNWQHLRFDHGGVKGTLTAWLKEEKVEKIELRDVTLNKIGFHWSEKGKGTGLSGSLEGSWRHIDNAWTNNHLMFSFHMEQFQPIKTIGSANVQDIEGEGFLEKERMLTAYAKGRLGEIPLICTCEEKTEGYQFSLSSDATLASCLKTCGLGDASDLQAANEILLQMRFTAPPSSKEGLRADGTIQVHNSGTLSKEMNSDVRNGMDVHVFWPADQDTGFKGTAHAEALPLAVCLPFLKKNLPEARCEGIFGIEGRFDTTGLDVDVAMSHLHVTTPHIDLEFPLEQEKCTRGKLTVKWGEDTIHLFLPLERTRCKLPAFGMDFSNIQTNLELDKKSVFLHVLHAQCERIELQGQIQLTAQNLIVRTDQIKGRLENLETLLRNVTHGTYKPLGIAGDFASGKEGLFFEAPLPLQTVSKLVFNGGFSSGSCTFSSGASLQDVVGALAFDSRHHCLKLTETRGIYATGSGPVYHWSLHPSVFTEANTHWQGSVDALLSDNELELLRCKGLVDLCPETLTFTADPHETHFFGSTIERGKGIYFFAEKQWKLNTFVHLDLQQLPALQEFICDMQLVKPDTFDSELWKKNSSGIVDMALDYDSSGTQMAFSSEGKYLYLFGMPCTGLFCKGTMKGKEWNFSDCRLGDNRFQFNVICKDNHVVIPSFQANIAGSVCNGFATYSPVRQEGQCQIDMLQVGSGKKKISCKCKQPFVFSLADKKRGVVKNISLEEISTHSQLICPQLDIDWENRAFVSRNIEHRLVPSFLQSFLPSIWGGKIGIIAPQGILQGNLHIEGDWQEHFTYRMQTTWKECTVKMADKSFLLSHVNARYKEGNLLAGCKTMVGQTLLLASLQIDQGDEQKEALGVFKIQESPNDDGISLFFKRTADGKYEINHMKGACCGVQADFRRKHDPACVRLQGFASLDFTKIQRVLPNNPSSAWHVLQLGKGFSLAGDITYQNEKFGFHGEMEGQSCELLGCQIENVQALINCQSHQIKLEKFQLADPALTLNIRKLTLDAEEPNKWSLSCPIAQAREFQPSRLRKIGKNTTPEKPFVIRNLTLTDVKGDLSQPKSWVGGCSLHFTNAHRKEESVFDGPKDFLKNLGLDPSLLVPVQGELEGRFTEGRISFTSLNAAYSEGRRTQFFLSDRGNGSFIDFQGNMHIDLAIKQAVLLKLAESLTLGIRGSVSKPSYVLLP